MLFVSTYAPHRWSIKRKTLCFFTVLPMAQLVPLFIWVGGRTALVNAHPTMSFIHERVRLLDSTFNSKI